MLRFMDVVSTSERRKENELDVQFKLIGRKWKRTSECTVEIEEAPLRIRLCRSAANPGA